jgi:hypothetical protein
MKFSCSERVRTDKPISEVLETIEEQFRKVSGRVENDGIEVRAYKIAASFGSANRNDVTTVAIKPKGDGFLLIANTDYSPSGFMFILLIILFFTTGFGFFIPIAFYILNKSSVVEAIGRSLKCVRDELE